MSYSFYCTTKDSFLNMSIKIRDCPQNYDAANEKYKFHNLCGLSTESFGNLALPVPVFLCR